MAYSSTAQLLALFDDLVRCETRLYNAVGEALRREHGITTTQFEFLRHLRDHANSRVVDVATNFAAGIGAISKGIDRLEAHDWVVRDPHPSDGRSSVVSLTRLGCRLVRAAEATFQESLEAFSSSLSESQVRDIGTALAILRKDLEARQVGIPAG